jgi:Xaa-Pro dipeptidase
VRYLTGLRAQIIAGKSALLNLTAACCFPTVRQSPRFGRHVQRAKIVMPVDRGDPSSANHADEGTRVRGTVEGTIRPLFKRLGLIKRAWAWMVRLLIDAISEMMPGLQFADADIAMQAARLIKFLEEIAIKEEAAAIAEAVTHRATDVVHPGVRETDVVVDAMRALFRLGGEQAHVDTPFVASGEHMAPPNRIASDKIIRDGDLVFIDIRAMWSGYFGGKQQ